jgi:hypothetical protein
MAQMMRIEPEEIGQGDPLRHCRELERGNILFFPKAPFEFPQEDLSFLLGQRQGGASGRKNIAYKPGIDRVTNHETDRPEDRERMLGALRLFSNRAAECLSKILPPYAGQWQRDYASFRPFQEKGRKLRQRARNDLLHVDAFPTRPLHGARILRFFININPTQSRHWMTSKPFGELVQEFGGNSVPFPKSAAYSLPDRLGRRVKTWLRATGLKIPLRSPYDAFMLRMHHYLKENGVFQAECPKDHWHFPSGSCWAVFTDQVSHAALSGQYALEQTFLVPYKSLLYPDLAPVSILERLSGGNMIDAALAGR